MQRSVTNIAPAAVIAALPAICGAQPQAQPRVEVGVLTCFSVGATGFVVLSTRHMRCRFNRKGRNELYSITYFEWKVGTDNSHPWAATGQKMAWTVLAPTARLPPRSLVGSYGGIGGEAPVGVGRSADALIGGSGKSILLQPVSVKSPESRNLAGAVASLQLRAQR
jgi:hypothetical protein